LVIIHSHTFILASTVSYNPSLISQFLVFDLWRCAWAKLPRFPPHCPGQELGRGWIVHSASGLGHIFEWSSDSEETIPIELPTGCDELDVMIHGLISFKKSLKKAIEEMKEESIRVKVGSVTLIANHL